MLNGQKLQGPPTAAEVNAVLRQKGMEEKYDFFHWFLYHLPPAAVICFINEVSLEGKSVEHMSSSGITTPTS